MENKLSEICFNLENCKDDNIIIGEILTIIKNLAKDKKINLLRMFIELYLYSIHLKFKQSEKRIETLIKNDFEKSNLNNIEEIFLTPNEDKLDKDIKKSMKEILLIPMKYENEINLF